jgi:hypothetical protein
MSSSNLTENSHKLDDLKQFEHLSKSMSERLDEKAKPLKSRRSANSEFQLTSNVDALRRIKTDYQNIIKPTIILYPRKNIIAPNNTSGSHGSLKNKRHGNTENKHMLTPNDRKHSGSMNMKKASFNSMNKVLETSEPLLHAVYSSNPS